MGRGWEGVGRGRGWVSAVGVWSVGMSSTGGNLPPKISVKIQKFFFFEFLDSRPIQKFILTDPIIQKFTKFWIGRESKNSKGRHKEEKKTRPNNRRGVAGSSLSKRWHRNSKFLIKNTNLHLSPFALQEFLNTNFP